MSFRKRFWRARSGATAAEYGSIVAGIAIAIISVVNSIGGQLENS